VSELLLILKDQTKKKNAREGATSFCISRKILGGKARQEEGSGGAETKGRGTTESGRLKLIPNAGDVKKISLARENKRAACSGVKRDYKN